jgi:hypothetical protein
MTMQGSTRQCMTVYVSALQYMRGQYKTVPDSLLQCMTVHTCQYMKMHDIK